MPNDIDRLARCAVIGANMLTCSLSSQVGMQFNGYDFAGSCVVTCESVAMQEKYVCLNRYAISQGLRANLNDASLTLRALSQILGRRLELEILHGTR